MGQIKLLDCTLRDGGYVNDWKFGHDNMVSTFERLVDAGVDIIEIGFLDERRPFDVDRSIMPDTSCVEKIFGGLDRKQAMVVGMIDYGTCGLENIQPCSESYLDGIRVIFKKHLREDAMAYCGELVKLGYKVFAQLVSVTSYDDEEMLDLARLANKYKPYAVSMVDTYGLMHQNNLMHYFKLLNDNLDIDIGLGYHAHNNFQMGYANCIAMLSNKIERAMVVDGTIYGMGKSAGNAPIELIMMHMNANLGTDYHISQILEAIDSNISQFYSPATWGYNMFFYLAASNDCHPSYVSFLMDKKTLSVKSIVEILRKLEGDKKLLYDQKLIEKLYLDYQLHECDDTEAITELECHIKGKSVVVLGPGPTFNQLRKDVEEYINKNDPVVISINFMSHICKEHLDFVFLTNSKRYVQMAPKLKAYNEDVPIIATSNVTKTQGQFPYVLNYSSLIDPDTEIIDNSLIMLLKALRKLGAKDVALAGFDGYKRRYSNFYKTNFEHGFEKDKADYINGYVKNYLKETRDILPVTFITPSLYQE